jgi:hypothetical protein
MLTSRRVSVRPAGWDASITPKREERGRGRGFRGGRCIHGNPRSSAAAQTTARLMVALPNDVNLRYSALLVLDLFLTVSIQMIGFAPRQILDASQSISSDGGSPALVVGYNPGQNNRTCESGEIASDSPESIRLFMRSDHRRAPSVGGSLEQMTPDEGHAGSVRFRHDQQTIGDLPSSLSVVAVAVSRRNVAVGAVGPKNVGPTPAGTRLRSKSREDRPGKGHTAMRHRHGDSLRTHAGESPFEAARSDGIERMTPAMRRGSTSSGLRSVSRKTRVQSDKGSAGTPSTGIPTGRAVSGRTEPIGASRP